MPDSDTPYDLAFAAARDAASDTDLATLRDAIERFQSVLHAAVIRIDSERAMTPGEILDAFRPRGEG